MNVDPALAEFWIECEEITQRVSSKLALMEKGEFDVGTIDSMYRDIHTMKGSAQLFGLSQIGRIAHLMETSLEPVRSDQTALESKLIELLYKGIDVIDKMVKAEKDKEEKAKQDLNVAIPQLAEISVNALGGSLNPSGDSAEMEVAPQNISTVTKAPVAETPAPVVAKQTQAVTPSASSEEPGSDSSSTIRVPVSLLDRLMTLMGEMVLVRNQVIQYSSRSDDLGFLNLSQRLDVVTSEIQNEMMKTRMQPIGNILNKFQRLVRDISHDLGKKIELNLFGSETELDKTLLEAVKDPLTHIIRNACDHGLETPDERKASKKGEGGKITVRAFHEGGQVIIEVSDDGRGLHKDKLISKALEKGLITSEKASSLTEREIFNLIFLPGFSTAAKVSNLSGRGVGMDVVRTNIDKIGGIVELTSVQGQGTSIRLKIPLTLAIVPAMIISCDQDRYAIPQVKLVELVRVEKNASENNIEYLQGKAVYRLRGNLLPLVYLKDAFGFPTKDGSTQHALPDVANIVVLRSESQMFGLIVDEIQDTADIVVKPLSRFLKSVSVYSGATVLGDGSVALILDVIGIAHRMRLVGDNSQANDHKQDHVDSKSISQDMQEFLLFKLKSPGKHALPLDLVHRLEEFKSSSIEYSGDQRVIRYRDSILPIISLNHFLKYETENKKSEKDVISVIVTQKGERFFGIEVDEILDVMSTEMTLDESLSDRPGILGTLIADEEVIVAVDSIHVLDETSKKLGQYNNLIATTSNKPKRAGHKILYAEDNSFFRKHVTSALMKAGYEVFTEVNGSDALEKLNTSDPKTFSVVISDIEMPKMTGLQFVTEVRKSAKWNNLPMVALTTKSQDKDIEIGKNAGFNVYLEKLKPEELIESLDKLIFGKAG